MFDLIDTAITGEQFLLALHDTLIIQTDRKSGV